MPDYIKELEAAYRREKEVRDYALLRLPHEVCGMQLIPLTPQRLLLLRMARNPFLCGGYIRRVDVAQMIWLLSPTYIPPGGFWARFRWRSRRSKCLRGMARIPTETLIVAIRDYLDEMFMDAPGSSADNKPPRMAFLASIIFHLAGKFTRAEIMEMPLPEMWQYLRADDPEIVFNRFSDRAKANLMRGMN